MCIWFGRIGSSNHYQQVLCESYQFALPSVYRNSSFYTSHHCTCMIHSCLKERLISHLLHSPSCMELFYIVLYICYFFVSLILNYRSNGAPTASLGKMFQSINRSAVKKDTNFLILFFLLLTLFHFSNYCLLCIFPCSHFET